MMSAAVSFTPDYAAAVRQQFEAAYARMCAQDGLQPVAPRGDAAAAQPAACGVSLAARAAHTHTHAVALPPPRAAPAPASGWNAHDDGGADVPFGDCDDDDGDANAGAPPPREGSHGVFPHCVRRARSAAGRRGALCEGGHAVPAAEAPRAARRGCDGAGMQAHAGAADSLDLTRRSSRDGAAPGAASLGGAPRALQPATGDVPAAAGGSGGGDAARTHGSHAREGAADGQAPATAEKAAPPPQSGVAPHSASASPQHDAPLWLPAALPPPRRTTRASLAPPPPAAKHARFEPPSPPHATYSDGAASPSAAAHAHAPPPPPPPSLTLLGTCSICWDGISAAAPPASGEALSELRPCEHVYHAACIAPWLAAQNTCPQCRVRVVARWGRACGLQVVPPADAFREQLHGGAAGGRMPYDDTVCQVCHDGGAEDVMLLCDGCDKGFHTHCVQLRCIPLGLWHCRRCRRAGAAGPPPQRAPRRLLPPAHVSDEGEDADEDEDEDDMLA
jgi:hypothetical protein